ncbi:unnamed protein product [Gongylonema pulchrum]|uniref:Post-GPI attachment to proteins factor 3 n=1 Tax=Gongylonema pulchrum TaxID=637853 RepID=A0A183ECK7_9BILA|nr:unnamed protein product [Gongylonema pulchrum]
MGRAAAGFIALVFLAKQVDGSAGDQHQVYLNCIRICITRHGCPEEAGEIGWIFAECFKYVVSCRYNCTWDTVNFFNNVLHNSVPQFHGKWPFAAFWVPFLIPVPIQELGSVVFSLMNMLSTLFMFRTVKRLRNSLRLKTVWLAYSLIGTVMW